MILALIGKIPSDTDEDREPDLPYLRTSILFLACVSQVLLGFIAQNGRSAIFSCQSCCKQNEK
jgi:hypothetical protein